MVTRNPSHVQPGAFAPDFSHLKDGPPAWRALLGFGFHDGLWTSQPQRPFTPRGLLIWGLTGGETLAHCVIAQSLQVLVSVDPVPARFFAQGASYEHIARLIAEQNETPAWCDWDRIQVGCVARLELRARDGRALGPDDGIELCMWGETLSL